MPIKYIGKTDDCWLQVQLEPGAIISVPYGLKVEYLERKKAGSVLRDYFKILEGVYKGRKASLRVTAGQNYLVDGLTHTPGVKVVFRLKDQTLHLEDQGPYNAFSGGGGPYTPIAAGTYDLAIPAYPSAQTRSAYNKWCKYHNLWFRVGTSTEGSRFLHAGQISEGCVTVRQFLFDPDKKDPVPTGFDDLPNLAKTYPGFLGLPLAPKPAPCISWDVIVDKLILSRKNDQAVGTLVVMP